MHLFEQLVDAGDLGGRLADDGRARDVAVVAAAGADHVESDDVARPQHAVGRRRVRVRGALAGADDEHCQFVPAGCGEAVGDRAAELALGRSGLDRAARLGRDLLRDGADSADQLDLRRCLYDTESRKQLVGRDELRSGKRLPQPLVRLVGECGALDSDPRVSETGAPQRRRGCIHWVLLELDVRRHPIGPHALAHQRRLECDNDCLGLAGRGDDRGSKPLAHSPQRRRESAGGVDEVLTGGGDERVETLLGDRGTHALEHLGAER